MKIRVPSLLMLLCLFFSTSILKAQKYVIDTGHSNVQINVERFGVVDVIGRFKDVTGEINFDETNGKSTSANAVIKVESYDANNEAGEAAVKSKAFLDAATFPEITFVSTGVSEKDGKSYLVGDLTIHGTTNKIELPFSIKGPLMDFPTKKQSVAFNASTVINRLNYGISFDRKLPDGTSIVGNDVKITLNVLALKE